MRRRLAEREDAEEERERKTRGIFKAGRAREGLGGWSGSTAAEKLRLRGEREGRRQGDKNLRQGCSRKGRQGGGREGGKGGGERQIKVLETEQKRKKERRGGGGEEDGRKGPEVDVSFNGRGRARLVEKEEEALRVSGVVLHFLFLFSCSSSSSSSWL